MEALSAYIPIDRLQAIGQNQNLPHRTSGTALFADISGFTPLTGIFLQALGPRRGADELTKLLNQVYHALITQVHHYGGSIISFGGDAITCWFDEDNGIRATASALAMQQAMKEFTSLKTPDGGTVSLALKIGAANGPVRRFLVGDPHIQYIDALAGATVERMVTAEEQAQKGEVVLSQEIVAQLVEKVKVTEWRYGSFAVINQLTETVEATHWLPFENGKLTPSQIQPWLLPPIYTSLHDGQEQFMADIRPAVVLFLKFSGLDYDHDEAAGEKLDAYIRWVQNTLIRYDSYVSSNSHFELLRLSH